VNRRLQAAIALAVLCVPLVSSCGSDEATGRRDPLASTEPRPADATIVFSEGIVGLPSVEPGGPPPSFGLFVTDTCVFAEVAAVDVARSYCMYHEPGQSGTSYIGGVHDDVSVAWLMAGDPHVASARFWMLDGTTFDQDPIVADGFEAPPVVFGHAVPAANEIVGVELLDIAGHVLSAFSIDGDA
jgi:hypothetical protein